MALEKNKVKQNPNTLKGGSEITEQKRDLRKIYKY